LNIPKIHAPLHQIGSGRSAQMISEDDYIRHDGLGLAWLVAHGEVSPQELAETAIARIERLNPKINAVINPLFDMALKRASEPFSGPFAGVPFLMKDLISTLEGVPTSSGNKLLKSIPAKADSELVKRWKKAGLNVLGKTNTPEFGLTPYTEPKTFGATRNPWDLDRTPGGSSGGSAAAVAARFVPLASGGDGGGSIRIPASACGLFGMKPTRGRTPVGPVLGEAWSGYAIEHVLTRSVRDSAAILDAVHGADVGAPYHAPHFAGSFLAAAGIAPRRLKIAVSAKPMMGKKVDDEIVALFNRTVTLLQDLGHEVIEAAPVIDAEAFSMAFITVLAAELRADIEETARLAGVPVRHSDYDPSSFGLGLLGRAFSAAEETTAKRYLQASARQVSAFFEGYDALLTPVLASAPVKIGALLPKPAEIALLKVIGRFDAGWLLKALGIVKPMAAETFSFIPWTPVFNVTGQPAMSVPLYETGDGLPAGMQFVGKFGDEATLFSLAGQLQDAVPWADRMPNLD
jgi:amidase